MDTTTLNWDSKRAANEPLLPLVILELDMGDRVIGAVMPPEDSVNFGEAFDADVDFDAEVYFLGGGSAIERSARLLSVDEIGESSQPSQADVLGAVGQAELPVIALELDNGDKAMSTLVGQEYLLNKPVREFVTFAGLGIDDALEKARGRIVRWSLTGRRLRLEAEQT